MSTRTIKEFAKKAAETVEKDRANNMLGVHCPRCELTWLVCEFPQHMHQITKLTAMHKMCPNCGHDEPEIARASQIRPLLGQTQ